MQTLALTDDEFAFSTEHRKMTREHLKDLKQLREENVRDPSRRPANAGAVYKLTQLIIRLVGMEQKLTKEMMKKQPGKTQGKANVPEAGEGPGETVLPAGRNEQPISTMAELLERFPTAEALEKEMERLEHSLESLQAQAMSGIAKAPKQKPGWYQRHNRRR